jgi:gas vesicle protein
MDFHIPTTEEIVAKYSNFQPDTEEAIEAKRKELEGLKKEELIDMLLESMSKQRTDTVQTLAKAILKDPDLIAANYEDIANAIKTIKPEAKTSAKSIASYVSKKRDEWDLPQRIRVTKPRS